MFWAHLSKNSCAGFAEVPSFPFYHARGGERHSSRPIPRAMSFSSSRYAQTLEYWNESPYARLPRARMFMPCCCIIILRARNQVGPMFFSQGGRVRGVKTHGTPKDILYRFGKWRSGVSGPSTQSQLFSFLHQKLRRRILSWLLSWDLQRCLDADMPLSLSLSLSHTLSITPTSDGGTPTDSRPLELTKYEHETIASPSVANARHDWHSDLFPSSRAECGRRISASQAAYLAPPSIHVDQRRACME